MKSLFFRKCRLYWLELLLRVSIPCLIFEILLWGVPILATGQTAAFDKPGNYGKSRSLSSQLNEESSRRILPSFSLKPDLSVDQIAGLKNQGDLSNFLKNIFFNARNFNTENPVSSYGFSHIMANFKTESAIAKLSSEKTPPGSNKALKVIGFLLGLAGIVSGGYILATTLFKSSGSTTHGARKDYTTDMRPVDIPALFGPSKGEKIALGVVLFGGGILCIIGSIKLK